MNIFDSIDSERSNSPCFVGCCVGRRRPVAWKPRRGHRLRPSTPQPIAAADLEAAAALAGCVDYLVEHQNKDGSWGSPALKGGVPIIAGIGSHHAYQVAVTAMSVSALVESGALSPAVGLAVERGEKHLFAQLPLVRRDDPMLIYNVWTHAYGIQALVRMYERLPDDGPRRERIRELIQGQYEKLTKYESAEGGWGYYDFDAGTQRPAASSTSFVNAAVLIAFHEAGRIGVTPPEKILRRAIQMTKKQHAAQTVPICTALTCETCPQTRSIGRGAVWAAHRPVRSRYGCGAIARSPTRSWKPGWIGW